MVIGDCRPRKGPVTTLRARSGRLDLSRQAIEIAGDRDTGEYLETPEQVCVLPSLTRSDHPRIGTSLRNDSLYSARMARCWA
jgi:hypothetical protein